jgi:hypothetical protein
MRPSKPPKTRYNPAYTVFLAYCYAPSIQTLQKRVNPENPEQTANHHSAQKNAPKLTGGKNRTVNENLAKSN